MRYATFFLRPPEIVPPTTETVITYIIQQVGEVYISERPSLLVSGGTTGMRTWEASLLLSEWLLGQDVQGKKVLELGAGTGLVGILAAKRGAKVMATDGSEVVITNIRKNFELNDVIAETQTLWWGEEDDILRQEWDFVLGADITYDEDECAILAGTYALSLKGGGMGIIAATVRNENTLRVFVRECGTDFAELELTPEMLGLLIKEIPGWDSLSFLFSATTFPMRLWQIQSTEKHRG
jgi:protein-lysine N-methyltransferase EEF2KMT